MDRLFRYITGYLHTGFVKNLLVLVTGTTLAQGISVIALPFLQKQYSPADFGSLSLFISLSTLLASVATLKLEYAVVLPKREEDARTLMRVSLVSVFLISILLVPVVYMFNESILPGISIEERKVLIWCLPISVFAIGWYEALSYWCLRAEKFKLLAKVKIVQNVTAETYRFAHIMTAIPGGLVIGRIVGYIIGTVVMLGRYRGRSVWKPNGNTAQSSLEIVRQYLHFPLFTMPTVFITTLSGYFFAYFFMQLYGDETTGIISVANQYIALPVGIIAGSFSQVFYRRISLIDDKDQLFSLYLRFSLRLSLLGLLAISIVYVIPDSLPSMVLDARWAGLMPYIKLSVIWQAISLVSSSLSFIYTRLLKQRVMFFFALLQLGIVYGTITGGHTLYEEPFRTFAFYVFGQAVYYCFTIVAALYFIKSVPPQVLTMEIK